MGVGKVSRHPALILAIVAGLVPAAFADPFDSPKIPFNVPTQPIDTALVAFAAQAHVQLVIASDSLRGMPVGGVTGRYAPRAALEVLLRDTGLEFQITGPETVTVRAKQPEK